MVYFVGDTHCEVDIWKVVLLSRKVKPTREDILIILGDCGVLFENDRKAALKNIALYESLGFTILYIDGNHENFPLIFSFPEVTVFGAKAHKIGEHLYHIQRGEVMEIEGHTYFCMGGATSIDKAMRVEGYSWWKEEHIGEEDMENGWKNLERYDNKVDFVLTHCVDSTTVWAAFRFRPDEDSAKLEEIEARVEYKMWLFGHYHKDQFVSSKKACLYERVGYLEESSDILFDFIDVEE